MAEAQWVGTPPRKDTIGEDIPTIIPNSVEFGIGYRRMRREKLRRETECLFAPIVILLL